MLYVSLINRKKILNLPHKINSLDQAVINQKHLLIKSPFRTIDKMPFNFLILPNYKHKNKKSFFLSQIRLQGKCILIQLKLKDNQKIIIIETFINHSHQKLLKEKIFQSLILGMIIFLKINKYFKMLMSHKILLILNLK